MTCDTTNESYQQDYTYFITEIQPKIAPLSNELNEKILKTPLKDGISDPAYKLLFRNIEKDAKIFREENIALNTEIQNSTNHR